MDPENINQLYAIEDDEFLQFEEEEEDGDMEELDFAEIEDDDLFDDPYIYLAIL